MSLSDTMAIIAAKLSARAIRAVGAGLGSNLPGRVARSVSPGVLARLCRRTRRGIIAVTGTNGKSTTAGLIYSILRRAGLKTVHNRQGANLVTGITATVIEAADWSGDLDVDYCLFEIDEASLPVVAEEVDISAVLVTNLFRDQLDRFGELDTTARLIDKGIRAHGSRAVLNADDPNVAQLATDCPRLYYGIESVAGDLAEPARSAHMELSYCQRCGSEYCYDRVFYAQLGHYRCAGCGERRPVPDITAAAVALTPLGSAFTLNVNGESQAVTLNLPGLFNVYNALAAAAVAHWYGIASATIREGIVHYTTLFGRSERLSIDGRSLVIQLIKNPAGASQVVATVAADAGARVLLAINDNLADGRDVSWLWDAEFERLGAYSKELVVSGQRAYDMAVRMKYAGVLPEKISVIPALQEAVRHVLSAAQPDETLWILPTYTCLLELRRIFKAMGYQLSGT